MNAEIHDARCTGKFRLNDETWRSRHGIPLLLAGERAFRPSDLVEVKGGRLVAAQLVHAWARQEARTLEEIRAARLYLGQWPEGPQLE